MHACVTLWLAALSVWAGALVHLARLHCSFPLSHSKRRKSVAGMNVLVMCDKSKCLCMFALNVNSLLQGFYLSIHLSIADRYTYIYIHICIYIHTHISVNIQSAYRVSKHIACYFYAAHQKCTHLLHSVDLSLGLQGHIWEYAKKLCERERAFLQENMFFVNSCTSWSREKKKKRKTSPSSIFFRKYLKISHLLFPDVYKYFTV